jgi:hypothetical protein
MDGGAKIAEDFAALPLRMAGFTQKSISSHVPVPRFPTPKNRRVRHPPLQQAAKGLPPATSSANSRQVICVASQKVEKLIFQAAEESAAVIAAKLATLPQYHTKESQRVNGARLARHHRSIKIISMLATGNVTAELIHIFEKAAPMEKPRDRATPRSCH